MSPKNLNKNFQTCNLGQNKMEQQNRSPQIKVEAPKRAISLSLISGGGINFPFVVSQTVVLAE